MTCSHEIDWKEYILNKLSLVDECVRDTVAGHIRTAFCLYAPLACGDAFLGALYAQRYLLGLLIARFASSVNYYVSRAKDIGRYARETNSRSDMQSESVSQSSRRADTTAISRENSYSRSEAKSNTQDYSASQSFGAQSTVADDTGSGASQSQARGTQLERGNTAEDSRSQSLSRGESLNADGFASYAVGSGATESITSLFQITSNTTEGSTDFFQSCQLNRSDTTETGTSRGTQTATSLERDQSSATSFAYFNDLSDSVSRQDFASSGVSRGTSDSTSAQRDEGRGFGIAESRSNTQQSSRYDMKSDSEMQSEVSGITVMNQEVFAKDLSDIAEHLQWMYDNNERDIAEYLSARNKMIFVSGYLQRFVEKPQCWRSVFVPVLLRHDNLNVCVM